MDLTRSEIRSLIVEEIQREEVERLELLQEWTFWDSIQAGLTVGGLIPIVGGFIDAINAMISLARGNPFEALLSVISIIPGAGDLIGTTGKVIYKLVEPLVDIIRATGKIPVGFGKTWYMGLSYSNRQVMKPALEAMQQAAAKYSTNITKFFDIVKTQNVDDLIRFTGKSVDEAGWATKRVMGKLASFWSSCEG